MDQPSSNRQPAPPLRPTHLGVLTPPHRRHTPRVMGGLGQLEHLGPLTIPACVHVEHVDRADHVDRCVTCGTCGALTMSLLQLHPSHPSPPLRAPDHRLDPCGLSHPTPTPNGSPGPHLPSSSGRPVHSVPFAIHASSTRCLKLRTPLANASAVWNWPPMLLIVFEYVAVRLVERR